VNKRKARKVVTKALRRQRLGDHEARIAALEQQLRDVEQWPARFAQALRDHLHTRPMAHYGDR
jgi:hypothetical protein